MTSKFSFVFSAVLVIASLGCLYADSLASLFSRWIGSEDYSHGMFFCPSDQPVLDLAGTASHR